MSEVEVARPTTSTALLARGVTRAVAGLAGSRAAGDLPDVTLRRRGVRPDPATVAAYQQLVGEEVRDVLPAGYLHTLAFSLHAAMLARPDFPLPPLGMVHLANRVEMRRAVDVGEVLDVRLRAANLAGHRRGTAVDLVAEIAAGDDVVWRGVSTYLAKGAQVPGARPAPEGERPAWSPPTPTGSWRLPADTGRRYAAMSGDHNPIHTSRVAARAFGFARPIAHGMFTAAKALADVGAAARGEAFVWEVEFATPVLLPATVSVRVAPDGDGFALAAWSRKPHLLGRVVPL